jgi:hypothetical protein
MRTLSSLMPSGCVGVALLFAAACVAMPPPQLPSERRVGEEPRPGETTRRSVGETLYTTFDYWTGEHPRLVEGYGRQYLLGQILISPGTYLTARPKRDGGFEHCTPEPTYSGPGGPSIVCFFGPPELDYYTHVRVPPLKYGSWTTMDKQVTYQVEEVMLGEGRKIELLYQGLANDVIRLLYREYVENLVRPAFQQELTYTLAAEGPTEIQFRTLKIEVITADNNGLTYRILHGLQ